MCLQTCQVESECVFRPVRSVASMPVSADKSQTTVPIVASVGVAAGGCAGGSATPVKCPLPHVYPARLTITRVFKYGLESQVRQTLQCSQGGILGKVPLPPILSSAGCMRWDPGESTPLHPPH